MPLAAEYDPTVLVADDDKLVLFSVRAEPQ